MLLMPVLGIWFKVALGVLCLLLLVLGDDPDRHHAERDERPRCNDTLGTRRKFAPISLPSPWRSWSTGL